MTEGAATKLLDSRNYTKGRHHLSQVLRSASEAGSPLSISSGNIEQLIDAANPPRNPLEAIDRFLVHLRDNQSSAGAYVQMTKHDYPLLGAKDEQESGYFTQQAQGLGYVETGKGGYRLTPAGWDRLDELRRAGRGSDQSEGRHASEVSMELFISHSSQDEAAASALIDLVRSALGVPASQIRCTSVDGYRLPAGANTRDQLRDEIFGARAFVGLLSPASLASSFVLFELGARWGADRQLVPLLIKGVVPTEIPGPIADLNAISASRQGQVLQFVADLGRSLEREPAEAAVYHKQQLAFMEAAAPAHQNPGEQLSDQDLEHRRGVLVGLRREYLLSHDGLSPAMMAGTEPLPRDWVERRLSELGEEWRQAEYW